jgi:transposase
MKLCLTSGLHTCCVDEFARSVTANAEHRTVSEASLIGTACMYKVGAPHSPGKITVEDTMNKSVFYVGVDVGKEELWAAVSGRKSRRFAHTCAGMRALQRWAEQAAAGQPRHFCLEATGVYSVSVASGLHGDGDTTISMVNPAQIKSFARAQLRRTKTDAVDAQVILAFATSQQPPAWSPPSAALAQLHELVTQREAIEEDLWRWRNRAHAHTYASDVPSSVTTSVQSIIRALRRQLKNVQKSIVTLTHQSQEIKAPVAIMSSTRGVGEKTALGLLAHAGAKLFTYSHKELTAHAGLAPCHHQSGTSVRGKSHIAKQGNARLRAILYMPTLSATRHNPIIKAYYQHLLARGKLKKVALVACMRKLLVMLQAMVKHKTYFDPNLITLT